MANTSEATTEELWEVDSLASTTSQMRELVEQNKRLQAQMRLLMRAPLAAFVQPKIRGVLARKDFARAKGSAVTIQAFARMAMARVNFQGQKAAAITVQAKTRCYLVCVSHVVGKIVRKLKFMKLQLIDREKSIQKLKTAWCAYLKKGDLIDARYAGHWIDAVVIKVDEKRINVDFRGFKNIWDVWINKDDDTRI